MFHKASKIPYLLAPFYRPRYSSCYALTLCIVVSHPVFYFELCPRQRQRAQWRKAKLMLLALLQRGGAGGASLHSEEKHSDIAPQFLSFLQQVHIGAGVLDGVAVIHAHPRPPLFSFF